jgi:hypothetical protein
MALVPDERENAMKGATEGRTFRDLDGDNTLPEPVWPLEKWYAEVRDTRLGELSLEDLARAARQVLYPEFIVPLCLCKLKDNPAAGAGYDGQLAISLKETPGPYWRSHPKELEQYLQLAARAYEETRNPKIRVTGEELLKREE